MFAPSIAFVDLETTGTIASDDRITEVGIVRVDAGVHVSEWSSLVNPGCSIPPAIQALTGITNAMAATAPTFAQIADAVATQIADCIFVAHNARFDYGFLKHEFGRLRRSFSAKVLCTVKLSRRLYPQLGRHNLDTIIERHGLCPENRHRALGDARVLWQFVQTLYRDKPADEIDGVIARILKTPSLPPQLPADALAQLPEAPGVYRFYGLNPLPLYVGKSINLRERVAAHFSSDYRSANDARLSAEITRIEAEETAGELGALLRESQLIKTLLPAYNRRLRRRPGHGRHRAGAGTCGTGVSSVPRRSIRAQWMGCTGRFRRAPRHARHCAMSQRAPGCAGAQLGLERRVGPCFARQVRRCDGACVGAQTREAHAARLREALASYALQRWPHPGMVAVKETDCWVERTDVHVFDQWCWLGTAHDDASFGALVEAPPRGEFDLDIYRLLVKHLPRLKTTPLDR